MNDCHRVLKKGGTFEIKVPLFPSKDAIKDPMIVRYFSEDSFDYFDRYSSLNEYGIRKYDVITKEMDNNYMRIILQK